MNKLLVLLFLFILTACSTTETLYSWENYSIASYNYLKNADENSIIELKETYEKIITEQDGTRNVTPPGIYADYGFLLIQDGEVVKGIELLRKEIELYPESEKFISRIIKMVEL